MPDPEPKKKSIMFKDNTLKNKSTSTEFVKNSLKNKDNSGGGSDVKVFAQGSGGGGRTTGFASVSYKNVNVSAVRHGEGSGYSVGVKIPIKSKKR